MKKHKDEISIETDELTIGVLKSVKNKIKVALSYGKDMRSSRLLIVYDIKDLLEDYLRDIES